MILSVRAIVGIVFISMFMFPTGFAFANRHENICWSNPDPTLCGLLQNPFKVIIAPFDAIAPGYGVLFLWGPIVFGLWFKTKSPAIAAIFGVVLVTVLTDPLNQTAVGIGWILVAFSAGIGFIQIFQRIKQTV